MTVSRGQALIKPLSSGGWARLPAPRAKQMIESAIEPALRRLLDEMVECGRRGQHHRQEQADQWQRHACAVGDEGELEGDEEEEMAEIGRIADLAQIVDRAPA